MRPCTRSSNSACTRYSACQRTSRGVCTVRIVIRSPMSRKVSSMLPTALRPPCCLSGTRPARSARAVGRTKSFPSIGCLSTQVSARSRASARDVLPDMTLEAISSASCYEVLSSCQRTVLAIAEESVAAALVEVLALLLGQDPELDQARQTGPGRTRLLVPGAWPTSAIETRVAHVLGSSGSRRYPTRTPRRVGRTVRRTRSPSRGADRR